MVEVTERSRFKMLETVVGLTEMIRRYGAPAVETAGWRLAGEVEDTLAETVESTLAAEGAWGLVGLAEAGPALGGLGEAHGARLAALVDARSATHELAA